MFFDVPIAFLSGNEFGRTVYVRGQADGLPSVDGSPVLKAYQLLQVLKRCLWFDRGAQAVVFEGQRKLNRNWLC